MARGFRGLKKYQATLDKMSDDALHTVTERAFHHLITKSPVAIANFRANWFGGVDKAVMGTRKNYRNYGRTVKGRHRTIQSMRMTNPGVSFGSPPTAHEKSNLKPALKARIGQRVYISNNLDYAKFLEDGGSRRMAPDGVLHVSAMAVRNEFSKQGSGE